MKADDKTQVRTTTIYSPGRKCKQKAVLRAGWGASARRWRAARLGGTSTAPRRPPTPSSQSAPWTSSSDSGATSICGCVCGRAGLDPCLYTMDDACCGVCVLGQIKVCWACELRMSGPAACTFLVLCHPRTCCCLGTCFAWLVLHKCEARGT